ncbi:10955_t:CDS:1 [Ambispora gerdemannii]|uniref:10955_t:CDS:1 n=1 Tax=Ambispora gerdemannii TaxID=144530 RepID=A0A9N8W1Z7_9GLOM|nr:10955_t:CDS:1 [Ambispora gerdemannii]
MNTYEYLTNTEKQLLSKCSYNLTLAIEELTKPSAKKRDNPDKPPRPQNRWIIFRKDYEANIRLLNPDVKQEVKRTAKGCSLKWKSQSREVKDFFKILEKIACKNHEHIYPNYKYRPKTSKDSSCKKFIFREQKYPFTSSVKSTSINDHSCQVAESNASPSSTSLETHNNVNINRSIDNSNEFLIYNNNLNDNDYLLDADFNNINNNIIDSSPLSQAQIFIFDYSFYN